MAGPVYHRNVVQGSTEWMELRLGMLTASEMKFLVTPGKLELANNAGSRAHIATLLAQRLAGYTEDSYQGDDMLRGHEDEVDAKILYQRNYEPLEDCGFITNDRWGFTLGYSPDALVGEDGLFENKSRKHKFQVDTILTHVPTQTCPDEFLIQAQTGLLVSERKWLDLSSYSSGLLMAMIRVYPDPVVQGAILKAAEAAEAAIEAKRRQFEEILNSNFRLLQTERRIEREITL